MESVEIVSRQLVCQSIAKMNCRFVAGPLLPFSTFNFSTQTSANHVTARQQVLANKIVLGVGLEQLVSVYDWSSHDRKMEEK